MSLAEEISKLNDLKENGAITEQEFQEAKEALLAENRPGTQAPKQMLGGVEIDTKAWGMFIHLSQFCGHVFPLVGLIVPIVLWQVKKDESEILDTHGKIVANWIISEFIYMLVSGLLCLVLIGIPMLFAVIVAGIVYPIIGGVKANNGQVWRYPGSIDFFK